MFSRHVNKQLSAYCHEELTPVESRAVAEHLHTCEPCRAEYEEIKFGIELARRLPEAAAPESMWIEIESALNQQSRDLKTRSGKTWLPMNLTWVQVGAVAAGIIIIAVAASVWLYVNSLSHGWNVDPNGSITIGTAQVSKPAKLGIGQVLDTGGSSAVIDVANIGRVEVEPNTRVKLVKTQLTEHRLSLERGRMHARIWAPPKLFYVDTPSAEAIDLGCAYTLTVDDSGAAVLEVMTGWVELISHGRWARVPADGSCITRPGSGPGTPYFVDASGELIDALTRFDFENGREEALDTVINEARPRDSLTLWHLLFRAEGTDRERIYERLKVLVPPPRGVTREGVLNLDESMIEIWVREMTSVW